MQPLEDSRHVEKGIPVKTLPFKLEVVAEALVAMLPHTPADAEAKELIDVLTDTLAGAST